MVTTSRRSGRAGAALIIVMLVMLGITAVAHGLLLLAQFEYVAARAGVDQLAARLAAEAGVSTALGLDDRPGRASTPLWQSTDSAGGALLDARYSGSIRRLSDHDVGLLGQCLGVGLALGRL